MGIQQISAGYHPRDGTFGVDGLPDGQIKFTFEYPTLDFSQVYRMRGAHITTRETLLLPRRKLRTTQMNVRLHEEEEYLRIRNTPSIHSDVIVRCGQPGLTVEVEDETTKEKRKMGTTDASGECTFHWHESSPVRIALYDGTPKLLGSTEGYVTLPANQESVWDIPAIPGTLKVLIPMECEPGTDEAVQYSLHRIPENQAFNQVETVFGGSPPRSTASIASTARSVEFKSVRPGTYEVNVRLMAKHVDGRWLPVGSPLQSDARVESKKTMICSVR
jgi:hypothetical protein